MSTNNPINSNAGKTNLTDPAGVIDHHHHYQESYRDDDMNLFKVPSVNNTAAAATNNPTTITSNPFCMIQRVSNNSGSGTTTKSTAVGSISSTTTRSNNNGCWQSQHRSSSYSTPYADVLGSGNNITSTTQTQTNLATRSCTTSTTTSSNKKHCREGALVVSSCCTAINNIEAARASKDLNINDKDLRESQSLLQLLQSQNWERAAIRLLTTSEGKEEAQWNIVSPSGERERGAKKTDNANSSCCWSILSVIFPPLASEYQMDPPSLLIKALMEYNMDYVAIPRRFNLLISALNVNAHRDIIQTICDVSPHAVTTKNVSGDLPIHFALKKAIKDINAFGDGDGGRCQSSSRKKKHQQIMILLKDSIQILIQTDPKCLMELDSKGDTVLSLAMRASSSSFDHDGRDDGTSSSNRFADLDFVSLILQYDPEAPNRPNPQTNVWPLEEACLLYSWSSANTLLQKHPSIFMNQPSKFGGRSGKLPFHVAFECRSSKDNKFEFVKHILEYYPHYVTQVDPTERLAPFMLTAIGGTPRHVAAAANTTSSSTTKQTVTRDDEASKEEEALDSSPSTNSQYNTNASKSNQKSTTTTTTTTTTACLSSTFALLQNSPDMLWYRG